MPDVRRTWLHPEREMEDSVSDLNFILTELARGGEMAQPQVSINATPAECRGIVALSRNASLTAPLRAEVERLTRERDEALRGFGIGPNEPVGLKRYAEVFTREIRECPPRTQDTEGAVCACVSVITAHIRRMLQERLDALSRAERAEAENARLRAALQPFQRIIADNVLGPQRPDGQKFTLAEAKDDALDVDFTVGDFRAAARALAEGQR